MGISNQMGSDKGSDKHRFDICNAALALQHCNNDYYDCVMSFLLAHHSDVCGTWYDPRCFHLNEMGSDKVLKF